MLKYASSAAHIAGKTYTSSETFTWLTEHFRTSLSQCKPDMDLMFVSGVNHMFSTVLLILRKKPNGPDGCSMLLSI